MIMAVPAVVAILPASSLVSMPPRAWSEAAAPAIASIAGVMRGTVSISSASGSVAGGFGVEAVDVGEQDQEIGAHHGGDAGGKAVVVAVADLGGGDGVVLVDHRHGAELEQGGDGRAGVEVAAALLGVAGGEQDLPGGDADLAQHLGVGAGERDLADGGGGLALLELERPGRQGKHAAAERDGAGGDHQNVAAAGGEAADVLGQRLQPGGPAAARCRGRPAATSRP